MESPFDLATTMVLEQTQSREQSILEAVRTMETQLQATQREGLTRERVEGMQTYLETFRQTYVGETGRVFQDQTEDLDQRKRYLEQNLDNDAAALAGDPALDREGKIGVMNQITEQIAQLDASERLVQTVVESVMNMVEEFGVITLRNELARKEAPDTYSEIETFSEESLVPNFKSKTDDESTVTLETPAREWKDSAPATSQRLGKILESHASYQPHTPERKVKSRLLHGNSPKRPTPPRLNATFLRTAPNPVSQGFVQLQTPAVTAQQGSGPSSAPPAFGHRTRSRTAPTMLATKDHSKFISFDLLLNKIGKRVAEAIQQANLDAVQKAEAQLKRIVPPGYQAGAWFESVSLKEPLKTKSGTEISQEDLQQDRFYKHYAKLYSTIQGAEASLI